MRFYSKNIMPDSLSGIVFALEGIRKSAVIINGPTGCKFYHSAISDNQYPRQLSFDPLNYPEVFYFGQPRVPCTYLDSYDYVYGSKEKINKLLTYISDGDYELIAIVNSPGAALIGDDLAGIASKIIHNIPLLTIESPGYSQGFYQGFQEALINLIKSLPMEQGEKRADSINLIGLSIYNKYFKGDLQEIKSLLELCGVQLNCVLCADTKLEEIKKIPQAALNVILYPELGLDLARYLQNTFGLPYFVFDQGLPIGFDLTEKYITGILNMLADGARIKERKEDLMANLELPEKMCLLIRKLEQARADAYLQISRLHSMTGLPRGATFSIEAPSSALLAYTDFLFTYLGMIPECIVPLEGDPGLFSTGMMDFLAAHHLESSYQRNIDDAKSDILLANGNTIAQYALAGHKFSGIEIELPSMGYIDVIPKTHLGVQGSLLLVEQVLNGMNL